MKLHYKENYRAENWASNREIEALLMDIKAYKYGEMKYQIENIEEKYNKYIFVVHRGFSDDFEIKNLYFIYQEDVRSSVVNAGKIGI